MAKLKVYGGYTYIGKSARLIVATTSQKKAAQLTRTSLYEFRNYWTKTANKVEVAAALANPETPLLIHDDGTYEVYTR